MNSNSTHGHNHARSAILDAERADYAAALADIVAATGWRGLYVDSDAHYLDAPCGGILGSIDGERASIYRMPNGRWSAWRGLASSKVRASGPDAVACALALRAASLVAA